LKQPALEGQNPSLPQQIIGNFETIAQVWNQESPEKMIPVSDTLFVDDFLLNQILINLITYLWRI
jgi:hypothetical protein